MDGRAGCMCASWTDPASVCQFAAVMNEKKAKLRQLRDRIQELEQQAEEGPDLVCLSSQASATCLLSHVASA